MRIRENGLSPAPFARNKKIAALVLAAGRSSRAKSFKPLLRWGLESFLEKVCRSLFETSRFEEILVVTGFQKESLEAALLKLSVNLVERVSSSIPTSSSKKFLISSVYNERYTTGMQSSIQCGLRHLSKEWDGVLIALVDQPQLDADDYSHLIQEFFVGERGLARCCPMTSCGLLSL